MFNKVILCGSLVDKPVKKVIKDNLSLAILTLQVDRQYIKNGTPFEEISLIDCELWGRLITEAELLSPGANILIEGRLKCIRRPSNQNPDETMIFMSVVVEKLKAIEPMLKAIEPMQIRVPEELPF